MAKSHRTDLSNRKQYKISDDLVIAKDHYGWIVRHWRLRHDPKTQQEVRSSRDSYYMTLAGAAAACIEKGFSGAELLQDIPSTIRQAEKRILGVGMGALPIYGHTLHGAALSVAELAPYEPTHPIIGH